MGAALETRTETQETAVTVTVATAELKRALDRLARVVVPTSADVRYRGIAVTPVEGALVLAASSGDRDLEITVPAEAAPGPTRLAPGALLAQVARSLPAGETTLRIAGPELSVAAGSFSTQIFLIEEGEELPLDFGGEPLATLPAEVLAGAVKSVLYAVSNEEYRAVFRGAQIELDPQRLRAVASDGFRLALREHPLTGLAQVTPPAIRPADDATEPREDEAAEGVDQDEGAARAEEAAEEPFAVVVPKAALEELLRNLPGEGSVELRHRPGALVAVAGGMRYAAALLEGAFPDYTRVIPEAIPHVAEVDVRPFREALRRVLVVGDANARVDLAFEEGRVQIVSEGDYGRGEEVVELAAYQGEPLTVVLNGRYLEDALGPVGTRARLELSGHATPLLVCDAADAGYLAVVVPLRV